jgi:hypothetical protein
MIDGLSGLWDAPAGGNRVCCQCGVVAHASVFPALAETTGSRAAGEEESPSEDTDRLTTGDPVGLGRGQDPDASSRQGETKRPRIMRR